MTRIPLIDKADAPQDIATFFGVLEESFGKVPNLFATIAHYPPSLSPCWSCSTASTTRPI